jgi:hypothetical protein
MTHDEIIDAWNKQADYMNKWNYLGEDEKLEWAIKLEREACAKVCEQSEIPIPIDVWHGGTKKEMTKHTALALANAIRARGQA